MQSPFLRCFMLLLISDRTEMRHALVRRLSSIGIFSFDAPLETGAFYCDKKDTGGVLLDCVEHAKRAKALCMTLRETYPELPIAVIVSKDDCPDLPVDRILRDTDAELLSADVADFYQRICQWQADCLSSFALTVGRTPEETLYMGYPLPLSQTEHTILRCLLYRFPHLTSSDDLMSLCYPLGGQSLSNLAVQIRRINERAAKIDPRPLIVNVYSKGYRLREDL